MSSWAHFLAAQEHYKDLLHEADQIRLARQALESQHERLYFRALSWLGHRLTTVGEHLVERYDARQTAPTLQFVSQVQPLDGNVVPCDPC